MKKTRANSKMVDRKTREKERRIHMKGLCYKLSSIVPSLLSQRYKLFTKEDLLDQSTAYIKQLRKRIDGLKEKKDKALRLPNDSSNNVGNDPMVIGNSGLRLPAVEVKELGVGLHVLLISRLKRNFTFYEVVSIIEEGGAEVVNANFTTVDDKVYYTLNAQARFSRVGVEVTSVRERLQELINRNS